MTNHRVRALVFSLALALTGCAVGPDYVRPPEGLPTAYVDESPLAGANTAVDAKWWMLYGDTTLNDLVASAQARNADILLAVARVEETDANLREAGTSLFPEFDLGAAGTRSRVSAQTAFPNVAPLVRNDVRLALSTSFELDFWGKLRRTREAARAQALASRYASDVVSLTMAGLVSQSYFSLRSLDAQVALGRQTLTARQEALDVVRARVDGGLASDLDLNQALGALADAAVQLKDFERQRELAEHLLGTLTGRLDLRVPPAAVDIQLPALPAAGLPSAMLDRRPDLRQAEQTLIASTAQIGVAKAAYFPAITLNAYDGGESTTLATVLASGARIWSVGLGATVPLFDFGRTTARVDAAEARKNQALASYARAVGIAFREVADALTSVRQASRVQQDLQDRASAARNSLQLVTIRYKSGYSAYLEVLDAQRTANDAELAVARNRLALLNSSVDLMKALGGGWREPEAGARARD